MSDSKGRPFKLIINIIPMGNASYQNQENSSSITRGHWLMFVTRKQGNLC